MSHEPSTDDDLDRARKHEHEHERRLRILDVAARVHADQMADIAVILRDLPHQIGTEVRGAMCDLASDENIDRMVGKALQQVRRRAYDGANATAWSIIKTGIVRLLQIVAMFWLAWSIGGAPLAAKVWTWMNQP